MVSTTSSTLPRVLFVGSNPSHKSADPGAAFHVSTKSGATLAVWCRNLNNEIIFTNVFHSPTKSNRPLSDGEVQEGLQQLRETIQSNSGCKVVALGKTASDALNRLGERHLAMPHPSGLNRQLNDREFVERKIKELEEFCSSSSV